MVDNYFVYNRIRDLSKTGTSGYQSLDQYNRDAEQITNMLAEVLCQNYEGNGLVSDALAGLIKTSTGVVVSAGGVLTLPDDYLHLDSMGTIINTKYVGFHKINRNEVDSIMSSSIRKFDATKLHLGYYKDSGTIKVLPAATYSLTFRYIRKPVKPVLALTTVTTADDDYQTLNSGSTVNFEFGSSVTDLIVYLMLEKLGIQMKDQIISEYANLGINRAMIKTTQAQ